MDQIAETLDRRISRQEGAGTGQLRKKIHEIVGKLDRFEGVENECIRRRLSEFVTALSPELRRDLLRVDPYSPNVPLALLNGLSYDRHEEVAMVEAFVQSLRRAYEGFTNDPFDAPMMSGWVRVHAALPDLSAALNEAVEADNAPVAAGR